MLIPVITFEIRDFTTGDTNEFVVENTHENQDMIFGHRYTRNIQFTMMFQIEFIQKVNTPAFMIDPRILMAVMLDNPPVAELEMAA